MAGRNSALRGAYIDLTAVFQDAAQNPIDPTDLKVSVYPPGSNPEDGAVDVDAWVYDVTLSSGGSGPEADASRVVEKVATGTYLFSFPIPADADLGAAFDRWEGTIDSEDLDETFTFTIVGGGSVGTTQLYDNNVVFITLDRTIAATDGSTLGTDHSTYFTTTYDPLYISSRQLRLELGPFISDLPDDTLNFAIFEAGRDADANCFQSAIINGAFLAHAKREYSTNLAGLMLVRALMGDMNLTSRMSKILGELSVSRGGNMAGLQQVANNLYEKVKEWRTALRTGGAVSPGTSTPAVVAVKGELSEDALVVRRQWEPTSGIGVTRGGSAANSSVYKSGRRDERTYISRESPDYNE